MANYFETRPWNNACMLPPDVKNLTEVLLAPKTKPKVRAKRSDHERRSTTDKTGQGTRKRIVRQLLAIWGPYCWLCMLAGKGLDASRIDMSLRYPQPLCFTRDHVVPRSKGGEPFAVTNQRPAHRVCNERRGNASVLYVQES